MRILWFRVKKHIHSPLTLRYFLVFCINFQSLHKTWDVSFFNGKFELNNSPDQTETERLLAELEKYHKEIDNAYRQAEADSDSDFERLGKLLKENLYSWWD